MFTLKKRGGGFGCFAIETINIDVWFFVQNMKDAMNSTIVNTLLHEGKWCSKAMPCLVLGYNDRIFP